MFETTPPDYLRELQLLYNRATPKEYDPEHDYASRRLADLLALSRASPTARILDLGCGTGFAGIVLTKDHPERYYEGIDLAHRSIQIANRLRQDYGLAGQTRFVFQDVADVRRDLETYDLILCSSALPLFESWRQILQRAHDWLRPGGEFLCSTYETNSFFNPQIKASVREVLGCELPDVKEVLATPELVKQTLSEVGFREVEVQAKSYDRLRDTSAVSWDGTWIHPENPLRGISEHDKLLLRTAFEKAVAALALKQALEKQVPDDTKVRELRRHLYTRAVK